MSILATTVRLDESLINPSREMRKYVTSQHNNFEIPDEQL